MKAEADTEASMVGHVMKSAKKNAKDAQWSLSRMFSTRWSVEAAEIEKLFKEVVGLRKGLASHSKQSQEVDDGPDDERDT